MISVVIPTYKNKVMFLEYFNRNRRFLKGAEIIIVNDNPLDSLGTDIPANKNIVLIENKKNSGFAKSINIGVRAAKNRIVMLLNSDVLLKDDTYKIAMEDLDKDRSLFAVSFAQQEKSGRIVGRNRIDWKKGLFYHHGSNSAIGGQTAWAEGGACLIDRDKFLKLDGFDSLYSPFYWEDIDLSYRAWKSGYKIIFNSLIIVEHHHETTIGKYFPEKFIKTTAFRNQFLFIWKNIADRKLITNHLLFLPLNIVYYFFKKEGCFLPGLIQAVIRSNMIKRQRYKFSDEAIIKLFS
jgi:O-antigen biosynthesis protein